MQHQHMAGKCCAASSILPGFTNIGSAKLLVGNAGCPPVRLEAPPAFVFHSANAYEEGGRLIADCVCYPRMPDFAQVWQAFT